MQAPVEKSPVQDNSNRLFGGRRWAFGIVGGYYAPTGDVYGLKVDPFGPTVGLTASWTMENGVWFGVQGQYFPGSTVSQSYLVPFTATEVDVDADTQLTSFGTTVGYDLPLGPIVIRTALEVGLSLVAWDLGDVPYTALAGYSPTKGSGVTPYLAPGMGIVIPFGGFFLAPEFRYRLEPGGHAPSSIGAQLHTGWRF